MGNLEEKSGHINNEHEQDKKRSEVEKKEQDKKGKDENGLDYIPPTPEPATDSSRKHDDPIRDHNPSVL